MEIPLLRKLKRGVISKWNTRLVLPTLGVLPPAIFTYSAIPTAWPPEFFVWLRATELTYPWLRTVAVICPVLSILGTSFLEWLRELYSGEMLGEREMVKLMMLIESALGNKIKRFGKAVNLTLADRSQANRAFREAILPKEQIFALGEAVWHAFGSEVNDHEKMTVSIASMKDNDIEDFALFVPAGNGPNSTAAALRGKNSTFACAARTRNIRIIPDVEKEAKKKGIREYCPGSNGHSNGGSLIVYPVTHYELQDVPLAIAIKHPENNAFSLKRQKRYEYILERFSKRISLENSIQILKEATEK